MQCSHDGLVVTGIDRQHSNPNRPQFLHAIDDRHAPHRQALEKRLTDTIPLVATGITTLHTILNNEKNIYLDGSISRTAPGCQQFPLEWAPRQSLHSGPVLHQSIARPVRRGQKSGARASTFPPSPAGHVGIPKAHQVVVSSRRQGASVGRPLQSAHLGGRGKPRIIASCPAITQDLVYH